MNSQIYINPKSWLAQEGINKFIFINSKSKTINIYLIYNHILWCMYKQNITLLLGCLKMKQFEWMNEWMNETSLGWHSARVIAQNIKMISHV